MVALFQAQEARRALRPAGEADLLRLRSDIEARAAELRRLEAEEVQVPGPDVVRRRELKEEVWLCVKDCYGDVTQV